MFDLPFSIKFEGEDYPLHDYYHDGMSESVRFAEMDDTYATVFEILLVLKDSKYTLEIFGGGNRLSKRDLSREQVVSTNWNFYE